MIIVEAARYRNRLVLLDESLTCGCEARESENTSVIIIVVDDGLCLFPFSLDDGNFYFPSKEDIKNQISEKNFRTGFISFALFFF